MQTQEELFYDIILLGQRVDSLKGWVQNNFDRMIADGTLTKEDLQNRLPQILIDFDRDIEKLSTLKVAVYNHIKNVAIKL